MRGGGVDDARRPLAHRVDQRRGLLGRLVRQAEDDDVDLGESAQLGLPVLALIGRQAAQRDAF